MVANLSVLQWLASFTLSAVMPTDCAYCRRHASLLLGKFMGFLNFRVEWRSSVIISYASMRTVTSLETFWFFGHVNHIVTRIIVNDLHVVSFLRFWWIVDKKWKSRSLGKTRTGQDRSPKRAVPMPTDHFLPETQVTFTSCVLLSWGGGNRLLGIVVRDDMDGPVFEL